MARQELDCSNCGRGFTFTMSFEREGNYRIVCPYCKHFHYRIVRDGRITGDRWATSSMPYQNIDAMKVPTRRPRKVQQVVKPPSPASFFPLSSLSRPITWNFYKYANCSSSAANTTTNSWIINGYTTSGTA